MSAQAVGTIRFVRRTELRAGEYRKNFQQIDTEIIAAITSPEADRVTPLMSKVYLRLVNSPTKHWERDGVLRFEAEWREGKQVKAWDVLCETLGVASATANKAVTWLHEQGVIGYFAGKNGVGLRIFLNRAASSIGVRTPAAGQKILRLAPASSAARHASRNEAAFNDSFAVSEVSDLDLNPPAPKNGAGEAETVIKNSSSPPAPVNNSQSTMSREEGGVGFVRSGGLAADSVDEIVCRLRDELEPALRVTAVRAAAREHERTREWLEQRGLPKAARVAQREAYNVLRSQGLGGASTRRAPAGSEVNGGRDTPEAKPLSADEIKELAEVCVAMLEAQGQSIDATLSGLSAEAGGCLLAEDAPKVRELAESMARVGGGKE